MLIWVRSPLWYTNTFSSWADCVQRRETHPQFEGSSAPYKVLDKKLSVISEDRKSPFTRYPCSKSVFFIAQSTWSFLRGLVLPIYPADLLVISGPTWLTVKDI